VPGAIRTSSREKDGRREYFWSVNAEKVQFITVKKWNENNQSTNQSSNQNNNQGSINYTRVDDDPFTNDSVPIDISSDDLPF
jgi:single-strand DNA-binding protein